MGIIYIPWSHHGLRIALCRRTERAAQGMGGENDLLSRRKHMSAASTRGLLYTAAAAWQGTRVMIAAREGDLQREKKNASATESPTRSSRHLH